MNALQAGTGTGQALSPLQRSSAGASRMSAWVAGALVGRVRALRKRRKRSELEGIADAAGMFDDTLARVGEQQGGGLECEADLPPPDLEAEEPAVSLPPPLAPAVVNPKRRQRTPRAVSPAIAAASSPAGGFDDVLSDSGSERSPSAGGGGALGSALSQEGLVSTSSLVASSAATSQPPRRGSRKQLDSSASLELLQESGADAGKQ